jgi:hypothetical protein
VTEGPYWQLVLYSIHIYTCVEERRVRRDREAILVTKSAFVSVFVARAREVWFRRRESLAVCNTCGGGGTEGGGEGEMEEKEGKVIACGGGFMIQYRIT